MIFSGINNCLLFLVFSLPILSNRENLSVKKLYFYFTLIFWVHIILFSCLIANNSILLDIRKRSFSFCNWNHITAFLHFLLKILSKFQFFVDFCEKKQFLIWIKMIIFRTLRNWQHHKAVPLILKNTGSRLVPLR